LNRNQHALSSLRSLAHSLTRQVRRGREGERERERVNGDVQPRISVRPGDSIPALNGAATLRRIAPINEMVRAYSVRRRRQCRAWRSIVGDSNRESNEYSLNTHRVESFQGSGHGLGVAAAATAAAKDPRRAAG